MDSSSSELGLPVSSTANFSARNKVGLKPGHSLMDWIRLTNSGKDLAATEGKCLEVSPHELAKHNSTNDAWICLRGRIYNITHYLDYHPGGEEELMRGAGKDATDLFNQVHKWVNADSMLQKCFVGYLKKSRLPAVPKFSSLRQQKSNFLEVSSTEHLPADSPPQPDLLDCITCNGRDNSQSKKIAKSDWLISPLRSESSEVSVECKEDEAFYKILIRNSSIKGNHLIIDLIVRRVFVKFANSSMPLYIDLPVTIKDNFKVETHDAQDIIIRFDVLKKFKTSCIGLGITVIPPKVKDIFWTLCEPRTEFIYWACRLIRKSQISHNTYLFTFSLPTGTKMWVPVGHHVHIKTYIAGIKVVRSYTPVISINAKAECCDELHGDKITLLIKIYNTGTMTPYINQCKLGDSVLISNYIGSFHDDLLTNSDSLVLLAAGTGITPMLKIIKWAVSSNDKNRCIQLLFFNKKEEDILLEEELKVCSLNYPRFKVNHILSEPSEEWNGNTGSINEDIINQFITTKVPEINKKIFICGPLLFTETALKCLYEAGYSDEDVHAFTGS